ncbi:hypothetical protein [Streptomyces spectabilis]|uniref:CdiI immunity protein domain-containing protein n=1 Tax=Streptomyces spectabilis TaxID=68270 RepID=A0A7W8EYK3_STRST|nr:hypothetical protein [Streptomyces spectabilis]MBB5108986.1 hypothetical protein [Streptomyces spectabilis]GGV50516.1 hypothetical protein GCM10010245_79580 [Streptomyces spectabilis]
MQPSEIGPADPHLFHALRAAQLTRAFEVFLRTYLGEEEAYDTRGQLRPTLQAFRRDYVADVREGFERVLCSRELSVVDYERLTNVAFADEDCLYVYLQQMHQYLFADGDEQPVPSG